MRLQTGFLLLALSACLLLSPTSALLQNDQSKPNVREEAYRANNIGVALLEQFKPKEASDAFKRALQTLSGGVVVALA